MASFYPLAVDMASFLLIVEADSQFQAAFLLTFRSFMDCNTFLLQMIKRYKDNIIVEPSPSISTVQSPQSPIQLR
jgi:hypothetical protein